MTAQKRPRIKGTQPSITVRKPDGTMKDIFPDKHVRLLGGNLQENASWEAHLEKGEKALLPEIRRKLGAIKHLGIQIPKTTKMKLINGFVISRLMYLLPIWGGTPDKFMNRVQTLMNKAARHVNNMGRMSPTEGLIKSCKWLQARNMVKLQSLVLMWKVVWMKSPLSMSRKITIDNDMYLSTTPARLQGTQQSFRWRTVVEWNRLPAEIRDLQSLQTFRRQVRKWLADQEQQPG